MLSPDNCKWCPLEFRFLLFHKLLYYDFNLILGGGMSSRYKNPQTAKALKLKTSKNQGKPLYIGVICFLQQGFHHIPPPQGFREEAALRNLPVVKCETIMKPTSAILMQFSSELVHHLDMISIHKLMRIFMQCWVSHVRQTFLPTIKNSVPSLGCS